MLKPKVLYLNPLFFGLNVAETLWEIAEKIKAVLFSSFHTKFWNDNPGSPQVLTKVPVDDLILGCIKFEAIGIWILGAAANRKGLIPVLPLGSTNRC